MKKNTLLFLLLSFIINLQAQQIKGIVTDVNNEPIPGVNIVQKGTNTGVVSNFSGAFKFANLELPATLVFSYVGFKTKTITVLNTERLIVKLEDSQEYLDDVVVTASRKSEQIKEAPVSIERYGIKAIRQSAAPSFYDGLSNLKGVDQNTNSLTFHSINTRGFANFYNVRFVQIVDEMDNSSPALGFSLGNIAGLNELDVKSIEILPGASSALYGANAFNGIINMRSKSPFQYKGLSSYVKYGQTTQKAAGTNAYTSVGARYAVGGEKFAAKVNFSFLKGTDWLAVDYSDVDTNPFNAGKYGSRETNPSYDGLNVYGDDFAVTLPLSVNTGGAVEDIRVSRTGYEEEFLTDNKAKNMKADIALHYRPTGDPFGLEIIWLSRFGTGATALQGSNRYMMRDFVFHQHKFEIKNKNFFIRAYYTVDDAGNSYDTRFTAWNINRKWRSDKDWFTDYSAIYAGARMGLLPGGIVYTEDQAHVMARKFADYSTVDVNGNSKTPRYKPGTPEFNKAFNEVISDPNFITGGKFVDNSNIKHVEANYNFKELGNFVDVQIGGSMRRYSLHSAGTIFTDYPKLGDINIDQGGAYMQIEKKMMKKKLKFATSLRYDKQKNLNGSFSPRVSLVYSAGKHKDHNFRMSYQTGFRNPTTQELYIGFNMGGASIIGGAVDNLDRYHETIILPGSQTEVDISGDDAYHNSYTLSSFVKFSEAVKVGDPNAASYLEKASVDLIKPEQISTYEFGYRGKLTKKLSVDLSAYFNKYNDFSASAKVVALSHEVGNIDDASAYNAISTGAYKPFFIHTNSKQVVKSYGVDFGLNLKVGNYSLGFVYDYAKLDFDFKANPDFKTNFNTPEHKVKLSLGNPNLFKNIGFSVNYKYQTEYKWDSSFSEGMLPARSIIDAQLSYNIKKYHTQFKIGGTNLLGKEYAPAPGTGLVGSIYYVGLTYGN